MRSVPRRRRLASQPSMTCWRESPASLGPRSHREAHLRRQQHLVAPALKGLADDLLRGAVGVDVGGVDERDPGLEAQVDLAPCVLDARIADVGEVAPAAEGHRPEGERRDPQAAGAELSLFHGADRTRHRQGLGSAGAPDLAARADLRAPGARAGDGDGGAAGQRRLDDDRRGRAPRARPRPGGIAGGAAVGRRRLRPGLRGAAHRRRCGRRPLRPACSAPHRPGPVHGGLGLVRAGADRRVALGGARGAGARAAADAAGLAGDRDRRVSRPRRARPRDRRVGRGLGRGPGARAACSAACSWTGWGGAGCSGSTCRSASS